MYPISSHGRRRGRWHARLAGSIAAVALALTASSARADNTGPSVPATQGCVCRGAVISAVPVASFSAAKLAAGLKSIGLGSWGALVHYGVDGYRVIYRTIAVNGSPTTASGLVVHGDGAVDDPVAVHPVVHQGAPRAQGDALQILDQPGGRERRDRDDADNLATAHAARLGGHIAPGIFCAGRAGAEG